MPEQTNQPKEPGSNRFKTGEAKEEEEEEEGGEDNVPPQKIKPRTSNPRLGGRTTHGRISSQNALQKMAEFSGEVSIYESQSLTLPGESLEISSDRFEALTFQQPLVGDNEPSVSDIERRERKRKRLREVKQSHAELRKLSAEGQEEKMLTRYEKLSSIRHQEAQKDPLVGACLENKYQIIGIVGKGANATVYKALRLLDEEFVAIKTLRSKGFEDVWRFNLEIEAMEKLNHKNLVQYIDCVKLDKGNIFLVMELIKGISLQEVLKIHGPILDEETIWQILYQVSDALLHAHKKGIIHRDLKSGNIIISKRVNEPLAVKVLDFGLAKHNRAANITMHGTTLGSPLYMSPEQCRGEEPTVQSDIYSLGIVAYELVAGVVPFIGETITDIMAAHCDPDVTHIPVTEVNPGLKSVETFDRFMYRALNTHTAFRFQNMEEFQKTITLWIEATRAI